MCGRGPTMLMSDTKAISQFIKKGIAGEDIVLKSAGTQFYSYTYVADAVAEGMKGQNSQVVSLLKVIADKDTSVYLDSGVLVGGIAPKMDRALGNISRRASRT